ncbi:MAG: M20/M25/M40 family metallo-hydrolase [Thermodesulfobacteriota bacterium]
MPLIQTQRLSRHFIELCEIDSPSGNEEQVAAYLAAFFQEIPGAEIFFDDSAPHTGSSTGNLIIRLPGQGAGAPMAPLFFNCHMDVISPCLGVKVQRDGDIFRSAGPTVLGGDDKAGIACLMEMALLLQECGDHCPLEFLFTTCEEIGLLGAKAFDPSLLRARQGFALDSTGLDNVIIGAPAAVYINVTIQGRAAHAGLNPEDGISAIALAAQAISQLSLGRLDPDSTANIGLIKGGIATNIIPDHVELRGEIRSHSEERLSRHIAKFQELFTKTVQATDAHLTFSAPPQYPAMRLSDNSALLSLVQHAATKLQRPIEQIIAGGGSDANVFNAKELETAILGIGMENVHSVDEQISLQALERTTELCLALATP